MKVLVIGATGPLGREIVKTTLARGHHVTAFVRRGLDLQHENLSVAVGDVMDSDSLNAPMAGQEAVICAIGNQADLQACGDFFRRHQPHCALHDASQHTPPDLHHGHMEPEQSQGTEGRSTTR